MKNFRISWKQIGAVVAFVVMFFLLMDLNNRINELNRLNNQLSGMQTEVAVLKATESALREQIVYATSEAAVNEYARNSGLVREGEKLIVPLGEGTVVPTQSIASTPTPVMFSNAEIWWALFFGD